MKKLIWVIAAVLSVFVPFFVFLIILIGMITVVSHGRW